MSNELIIVLSLLFIYSTVLLSFILFGKSGLVVWTVVATITANIEVLILIESFGIEQTLGNILFASTFLVTDILAEIYGKDEARKAVHIGIFTSIAFIIISQSWFLYTPSPNDTFIEPILTIFNNTPRLMFASIFVYIIVQRFDVWLYHYIWDKTTKHTNNKDSKLWIRNNLSTLVSQLFNTVLFTFIAFYNVYDTDIILSIIIATYIIFCVTSLLDTPFVYLARVLHRKYHIEENQ